MQQSVFTECTYVHEFNIVILGLGKTDKAEFLFSQQSLMLGQFFWFRDSYSANSQSTANKTNLQKFLIGSANEPPLQL
jgi:hypothetical protein